MGICEGLKEYYQTVLAQKLTWKDILSPLPTLAPIVGSYVYAVQTGIEQKKEKQEILDELAQNFRLTQDVRQILIEIIERLENLYNQQASSVLIQQNQTGNSSVQIGQIVNNFVPPKKPTSELTVKLKEHFTRSLKDSSQ